MNILKDWIDREGTKGRQRLLEAIKQEYPDCTPTSLSHYINQKRVPEYRIAQIISEVSGIPLFQLPYRYTNRPDGSKEASGFQNG